MPEFSEAAAGVVADHLLHDGRQRDVTCAFRGEDTVRDSTFLF